MVHLLRQSLQHELALNTVVLLRGELSRMAASRALLEAPRQEAAQVVLAARWQVLPCVDLKPNG